MCCIPLAVVVAQTNLSIANSTTCAFNVWSTVALAALTSRGIDYSQFPFRQFILPAEAGMGSCGWYAINNDINTITSLEIVVVQSLLLLFTSPFNLDKEVE